MGLTIPKNKSVSKWNNTHTHNSFVCYFYIELNTKCSLLGHQSRSHQLQTRSLKRNIFLSRQNCQLDLYRQRIQSFWKTFDVILILNLDPQLCWHQQAASKSLFGMKYENHTERFFKNFVAFVGSGPTADFDEKKWRFCHLLNSKFSYSVFLT